MEEQYDIIAQEVASCYLEEHTDVLEMSRTLYPLDWGGSFDEHLKNLQYDQGRTGEELFCFDAPTEYELLFEGAIEEINEMADGQVAEYKYELEKDEILADEAADEKVDRWLEERMEEHCYE